MALIFTLWTGEKTSFFHCRAFFILAFSPFRNHSPIYSLHTGRCDGLENINNGHWVKFEREASRKKVSLLDSHHPPGRALKSPMNASHRIRLLKRDVKLWKRPPTEIEWPHHWHISLDNFPCKIWRRGKGGVGVSKPVARFVNFYFWCINWPPSGIFSIKCTHNAPYIQVNGILGKFRFFDIFPISTLLLDFRRCSPWSYCTLLALLLCKLMTW